ncbi:MAG: hypothetical protein WAU52_02205 [Burkholderiales bacterium]
MSSVRRSRLYLSSALVLLLGLCAAAAIYLTAGDDANGAVGYEVINGVAYPVAPADSKAYQRELERFGGKANVLAAEITQWFAGLWQGRKLAFTVAFLTALVSLALYLYARYLEGE